MRRGFTLVELMVTIMIVALVTALCLPTWKVVTARANSAKCLSNLNSLGVSLQGYLADHNNIMPTLASTRASVNDQTNTIDNTLNAYADSSRVFICPADPNVGAQSGTSYYWNMLLNGQHVGSLNLLNLISQSSSIPVMLDKEGWHQYVSDRVNKLFADGHVATELNLTTDH